ERQEAGRGLLDLRRGRFGEAQVDDLDLVAAFLVVADCRAHQRGDPVEFFLRARLIDGVALVVLGVTAVDQNRRRDAFDAAAFGNFGLGRAGNLVVDDFFGLLALIARGLRLLIL